MSKASTTPRSSRNVEAAGPGTTEIQGQARYGSLYLNSGSYGRWLSEEELKQLTDFFVAGINDGKLCGLRVFRVASLQERPEYAKWTKESLANLRRT
jgi:hypothetical protein